MLYDIRFIGTRVPSVGTHTLFLVVETVTKSENFDFAACFIVIYEAPCFNVAQGQMNGAPNETRTYSCRLASQTCEPLHHQRCPCRAFYNVTLVTPPRSTILESKGGNSNKYSNPILIILFNSDPLFAQFKNYYLKLIILFILFMVSNNK